MNKVDVFSHFEGNIFIGHGLVLKIGDFGMSRHVENESETQIANKNPIRRQFTSGVIGTPSYSAPELTDERLQSHEYNQSTMLKADVSLFYAQCLELQNCAEISFC